MSYSAAPTMMTAFGLYQEEGNDESFIEAERMSHRLPLLEGTHGERAELAAENASVMEVVQALRDNGDGADSVQVDTIRWRGQSEAALRAQLQPILLHYRLQILLVKERLHRRALEMKETNERVPLVTEYYQRTPVKWRLIGYMGTTQAMLMMNTDSESMCRTPASTITSVSEVKRERQFRESFQRLEETVLRHGGGSVASTPVRQHDERRRSLSGRDSGFLPPFSPVPMAPGGAQPRVPASSESDADEEEGEAADEAFDSTVAFVDPAKRR